MCARFKRVFIGLSLSKQRFCPILSEPIPHCDRCSTSRTNCNAASSRGFRLTVNLVSHTVTHVRAILKMMPFNQILSCCSSAVIAGTFACAPVRCRLADAVHGRVSKRKQIRLSLLTTKGFVFLKFALNFFQYRSHFSSSTLQLPAFDNSKALFSPPCGSTSAIRTNAALFGRFFDRRTHTGV